MEETKEHWLRTALMYPFRIVASLLSSLSMDDKGWSLKKILAAYSTYLAGEFTKSHLAPNNVIVLVAMWLIYAGILVGIYSIKDISSAVGSFKTTTVSREETNTEKEQTKKEETKVEENKV